jgi:uncharacterized protein with HEPN domain
MSRHDPRLSLRQMLDYAREAAALAQGRSRGDLDTDRLLNLALVRLVEVFGEAARRVPSEIRSRCPAVPWTEIVGTRSRLIHDYDAVDFDMLWEIATKDLPSVVAEHERALAADPPSPP